VGARTGSTPGVLARMRALDSLKTTPLFRKRSHMSSSDDTSVPTGTPRAISQLVILDYKLGHRTSQIAFLRFFTVDTSPIIGPLRSRPFANAIEGTIYGLICGLLSCLATSPIPPTSRVQGWTVGGLIAGAIIGLLLPAFRKRWTAGLVMWLAMTAAIYPAGRYWDLEFMSSVPSAAFFWWMYRVDLYHASVGLPRATRCTSSFAECLGYCLSAYARTSWLEIPTRSQRTAARFAYRG
jgi:hypothetical protein